LVRVARELKIRDNPALRSLHALSALSSIGLRLSVTQNSTLPTCEAEWLRDRIGVAQIPGGALIEGNDDLGACAP
jgi:hypothetical protein